MYLSQSLFLSLKSLNHESLQLLLKIWCILCNEYNDSCELQQAAQHFYLEQLFYTHCIFHLNTRKNKSCFANRIIRPDRKWGNPKDDLLIKITLLHLEQPLLPPKLF